MYLRTIVVTLNYNRISQIVYVILVLPFYNHFETYGYMDLFGSDRPFFFGRPGMLLIITKG